SAAVIALLTRWLSIGTCRPRTPSRQHIGSAVKVSRRFDPSRVLDRFDNGFPRLLRLFFPDPIAPVGDNGTGHITGDQTHDFGHLHPEGMIAAERKYRHGQFALLRKQFVVSRILREC